MGSFPEMYIDQIKLVMLYCHAIYIYIYIFFLGGGGGGPKVLGEGWVVVVEMPQLKIMTIVSFQKAKYVYLYSISLVRSSYTLNP